MGVICTDYVGTGTVFGPIPGNLGLADPIYLIGHMTADNIPDVHTVQINVDIMSDMNHAIDWVPYVRPARDDEEQNMEAILKEGKLHYRLTRSCSSGQQLLVWYSNDLAAILGVPELQEKHIKGLSQLRCPFCHSLFKFPYSLRAHMRFKCDYKRQNILLNQQNHLAMQQKLLDLHERSLYSSKYGNPFSELKHDSNPTLCKSDFFMHSEVKLEQHSPTTSSSSGDRSNNFSPKEINEFHVSPPTSHRLLESQQHSPPLKKQRTNLSLSPISSKSSGISSFSQESPIENKKLYLRENNEDSNSPSEITSAFRKVENGLKSSHCSPPSSHTHDKHFNSNSSPSAYNMNMTGIGHQQMIHRPFSHSLYMQADYPFTQVHKNHTIAPLSKLNENIPMDLQELYRHAVRTGELPVMSDKLMDIHCAGNENLTALIPDMRTGIFPIQYYKSNNPMVEKLLQSTTLPVPPPISNLGITQNWCAKCNATFRMTSDLVYHMRSHHTKDKEPAIKKREEKLRCSICKETFRERHHLTRHMTSHS